MIRILICLILFTISPILSGMFGMDELNKENICKIYIRGIALSWGIFEIVCVVFTLLRLPFLGVISVFLITMVAIDALSVLLNKEVIKQLFANKKGRKLFCKRIEILSVVVIVVILFQTGMIVFGQHEDLDDASYISASTTTIVENSMYQYNQQTGDYSDVLDIKRALSAFPQFLAFLSIAFGVHPAALARTLYPVWAIPVSYLIYGLLAEKFFDNNKTKKWIFLFILCVYNIFGFTSVYTSSSFLLLRIWQGKASLVSLFIPAIWYLLWDALGGRQKTKWLYVEMAMVGACMTTTMGVMLAPISCVLFSASYAIIKRKLVPIVNSVLLSVPCLVIAILYIVMR